MSLKLYFDEQIAEGNIEKISFDSELWESYRAVNLPCKWYSRF